MHSTIRSRSALLATLLAFVVAAVTPTIASAVPKPGANAQRGFRLFARSLGAMTINRIYCGLSSDGQICVDSTNSSTVGGGFWPKGTADQYVFNTGLQLAGIIGTDGGPWAGDTTGAFFFDPKGTTQHGLEVRPIYNMNLPSDFAEVEADPLHVARVPTVPDPQADVFQSLLQGRVSASQGDIWFMSWDGDPSFSAGRPHPLGVVVETRGLGWNFPSGNEDLLYYVYTFYNVTSLNQSDYQATGVRQSMVDVLMEQAQEFHSRNNAAAGITLPTSGYTVDPLFAAFGTDMDVASAGTNWAGVILPFALGTTFDGNFDRFQGWTFDPAIFSAPFFAGSGFVGVKYLKSPTGAGAIQLYSNTINDGEFDDPQNTTQLYRYLSGEISVPAGDAPCNSGDPKISRICFLNNTTHDDMRFFQSSTPLTLAPAGLGTIVVSYIFAAPVAVGGCPAAPCADIPPGLQVVGNQAVHGNASLMTNPGVPVADSIAGYLGFTDVNADGFVTQDEYQVVPGSLLGKSFTAQAIFDAQFLLPFAPESPEFFLVPGDNQVTVLWRPSASETTPDPFFSIASEPLTPTGGVNALYDPNYRDLDVEGYRVYRGRVDAPNELALLGEFDYSGTSITDFAGQVNPIPTCAPEILITDDCAVTYGPVDPVLGGFIPGQARTGSVDVPLVGEIVQVKLGERAALADGTAFVLLADTAVTGGGSGFSTLADNGVPFVFVDNAVRNNFRYFYSVTSFDINSWQSGPTNLESARNTRAVVPVAPASNYENSSSLEVALFGRDVELCTGPGGSNPCGSLPLPTIDPTTGIFSGPMPPADGWSARLSDFVQSVIAAPGNFAIRLDSMQQGNPADAGTPNVYWWTGISGSDEVVFQLSALPGGRDDTSAPPADPAGPSSFQLPTPEFASLTFGAVAIDNDLASRYGGNDSYQLQGQVSIFQPGVYLTNGTYRGSCFEDSSHPKWVGQWYDGPRWFDGDPRAGANETFANPTGGQGECNWDQAADGHFSNAGALAGVTSVYHPVHYNTQNFHFRAMAWNMHGASRAADMSVFWGAGGTVDSVIDVTHNVPIKFSTAAQGTWGFLTTASQAGTGSYDEDPGTLTIGDVICVAPFITDMVDFGGGGCSQTTTPFLLQQVASIGPMGLGVGGSTFEDVANYSDVTTTGFGMYMPGGFYFFEMSSLPAAGDIWTLRASVGGILGGNGTDAAGTVIHPIGPYSFDATTRPMTAVGAEIRVSFDVVNQVNTTTVNDLSRVHTVPDPYYVTNEFETTTVAKVLKFVNLPEQAIIRIYSSSGVLVTLLEHNSTTFGGSEDWNVRNRNNQVVASGVYFYHIEAGDARRVGRMTVVNFAQ
jgi:hypothetical protein